MENIKGEENSCKDKNILNVREISDIATGWGGLLQSGAQEETWGGALKIQELLSWKMKPLDSVATRGTYTRGLWTLCPPTQAAFAASIELVVHSP
jgi:hypothetical protein